MLKGKIESELKQALKSGEQLKLSVFRMLSSAIHNKEIEKRARLGEAREMELTEEETVQVIRSELKKRQEAAEAYLAGGREEAAGRERAEAEALAAFLPPELSDEELEKIISQGQASLGVTSAKDFGKLMGWVMGRVKGQASGERVSRMIQRRLKG